MKNFLKRFEKLENDGGDISLPKEKLTAVKRFERLEVNDKKVEIAISDTKASEEKAPLGTLYYRRCPYCGSENRADEKTCGSCHHELSEYKTDYEDSEGKLKKCVCGAINLKERKFCWVCGRDFTLWGDEKVATKQNNLIVVNVDGKNYRSDDPNLPPGIVALMERIRREGYSKELVDEWVRQSNDERQLEQQEVELEITQTKGRLFWLIAGIVGFIFLVFLFAVGNHP